MNGVMVRGWSALSSAGIGTRALSDRIAGMDLDTAPTGPDTEFAEPLPAPGHAVTGFDPVARLGRKGTSTYDRVTALTSVCCQEALEEAGTVVDDTTSPRIGVVLGTTLGSLKSSSDFERDTLVHARPYMVNPRLFPTGVMNFAAGQVAIRFGLRGVNATLAGGDVAFFNGLRYAATMLGHGRAEVMLTGAAEEFTPHRAWAAHLTGGTAAPLGEGAAMFVLTRPDAPSWTGPDRWAHVRGVATGFGAGDRSGAALTGCVIRLLEETRTDPAVVTTVLTGEATADDTTEYGPVAQALGQSPRRMMVKRLLGECSAASAALALSFLLAADADPGLTLLTARGRDGSVGAALVEVLPRCRR